MLFGQQSRRAHALYPSGSHVKCRVIHYPKRRNSSSGLKTYRGLMSPGWRQNTQRTISPSFYENTASGSESTLIPTAEEIQKICPRFRILLIGKSGVGKTSLINEAFGVRGQVSSDGAGKADIDYEHLSEGNDLFAVHDSRESSRRFKTLSSGVRKSRN
ncbi:hypothetical protein F5887DRAFT_115872 [Amanita rubescens]|nr:hypothetical protein F5887DRAFT_115872 [Amanita rubescens]